jgi:hypothetical protein
MTYPSVHPTGATIYNPDKCWNGYTLYNVRGYGALLVNMNGGEVKLWENMYGFPNKLLPGGYLLGSRGERNTKYGTQDMLDLVQVDWDGKVVWKFDEYEYIEDPGEDGRWMARQHHDYQREGNSVGYYTPGMDPKVDGGNTLILCHKNSENPQISDKKLLDDVIIEVNWDGDIVWEWVCSDHFEELGFSEEAKNAMSRNPAIRQNGGDWMHINSMSTLGPNKWYDAGDERFHPDNIIWDGRNTNISAIIDKKTGNIVWQIGPDFNATPELKKLGWIIGQHHAHMIPRGLPGEGNIMIFDNGGWGGYGAPNPGSPTGERNALRDYSRVIEIDPTTLEITWQYGPAEAGLVQPVDANRFYSPFISSAQRLPNGNTLICEGSGGRLIEVTPEHEIVWEYINPYISMELPFNMVYRAYRVPYEWVPQLEKPEEQAIERVEIQNFRVPGAEQLGCSNKTPVEGTQETTGYGDNLCVAMTPE